MAGDSAPDDAPWSGTAGAVDSDEVETLIENNQRSARQETADTLKISKSIKLLVKMKNVSFSLGKKRNRIFGQPHVWNFRWLFIFLEETIHSKVANNSRNVVNVCCVPGTMLTAQHHPPRDSRRKAASQNQGSEGFRDWPRYPAGKERCRDA